MNCRGQAYDNAATMAGCQTGVQQRIKDINPNAEFVPYSNHSLNLVCVHAPSVEGIIEDLTQSERTGSMTLEKEDDNQFCSDVEELCDDDLEANVIEVDLIPFTLLSNTTH
ncbi:uncharacterized protein TNCV_3009281 [Trichonephila clavipes]|nr:uncharacterized protein TNCV_3009281 [Trichonephila clavipes]